MRGGAMGGPSHVEAREFTECIVLQIFVFRTAGPLLILRGNVSRSRVATSRRQAWVTCGESPTYVNGPDLFFIASVRTWRVLMQFKLVFTVNTAPLPECYLSAPAVHPCTTAVQNVRVLNEGFTITEALLDCNHRQNMFPLRPVVKCFQLI